MGYAYHIRCTILNDFCFLTLVLQVVFSRWFILQKLQQRLTEKVSGLLSEVIFSPGSSWDFIGLQSTIKYFSVADYMAPCIPDTGLCTVSGQLFLNSRSISGVSLCVKNRP